MFHPGFFCHFDIDVRLSHVIATDIDVYCAFAVIYNILYLEVAYDSMRLFTGICIISMILSCTYVMYYVLYRVLSYWYLLCSRKANFYVIHRQ